jgi:hypothetical protein
MRALKIVKNFEIFHDLENKKKFFFDISPAL